jgi:hypothetical protein
MMNGRREVARGERLNAPRKKPAPALHPPLFLDRQFQHALRR